MDRRPRSLPLSAALGSLLILGSCVPTEEVQRDLRGVWAPDDSSILLVSSEYRTRDPRAPYHADNEAEGFEVVLYEIAPPEPGAAIRRGPEIDRFPESAWDVDLRRAVPLSAGGLAQYSPVYWFPDRLWAFFDGGNTLPYLRRVNEGRTTWYPKPRAAIEAAFADAYPEEEASRLRWLAANTDYRGSVPSPDGTRLAALYALAEIPEGGSVFGDWLYHSALVLFDAESAAVLDTLVPLPDRAFEPRLVDGYAPLETENGNLSALTWTPSGDAIYVYYYEQSSATEGEYRRVIKVPVESGILGSPEDADSLPARPVPSGSGVVSSTGRALVLSLDGNQSSVELRDFPEGGAGSGTGKDYPWYPHSDLPLVPLEEFLQGSSDFSF